MTEPMRHRFKVAINKMYFPKEMYPKDRFTSFVYVWTTLAESRTEAVQKIWKQHGPKILNEVLKTTKAISLDCNNPPKQKLMNRLQPIRVYEVPRA